MLMYMIRWVGGLKWIWLDKLLMLVFSLTEISLRCLPPYAFVVEDKKKRMTPIGFIPAFFIVLIVVLFFPKKKLKLSGLYLYSDICCSNFRQQNKLTSLVFQMLST